MSTDHTQQDPAVRALTELMTVLDTCMTELQGARSRAEKLLDTDWLFNASDDCAPQLLA